MYKASEELAFNSEQNKRTIMDSLTELEEYIANVRKMADADIWHGSWANDWTCGFVGRDVARMGSMIARQQALSEAERMVKKQGKEE
jgi:hypothetical protein